MTRNVVGRTRESDDDVVVLDVDDDVYICI